MFNFVYGKWRGAGSSSCNQAPQFDVTSKRKRCLQAEACSRYE